MVVKRTNNSPALESMILMTIVDVVVVSSGGALFFFSSSFSRVISSLFLSADKIMLSKSQIKKVVQRQKRITEREREREVGKE